MFVFVNEFSAPEMHHVAKVKSRLSLHVPDNADTIFCQSDLISPIGRMNLSPCPGGKVSFQAVKCLFILLSFHYYFFFFAFSDCSICCRKVPR